MIRDFTKWSGKHDHPPDIAQCNVTKAIANEDAHEKPLIPVQQIHNAEAAKLTSHGRPGFDSASTIPTLILNPADLFDSDSNSSCLGSMPTPIPADFCYSDSNSSCLNSIPTPIPVQLFIPILAPAQLFNKKLCSD